MVHESECIDVVASNSACCAHSPMCATVRCRSHCYERDLLCCHGADACCEQGSRHWRRAACFVDCDNMHLRFLLVPLPRRFCLHGEQAHEICSRAMCCLLVRGLGLLFLLLLPSKSLADACTTPSLSRCFCCCCCHPDPRWHLTRHSLTDLCLVPPALFLPAQYNAAIWELLVQLWP